MLKKELGAAKDMYEDRLEGKLQTSSSREVWKGVRKITGYKHAAAEGPSVTAHKCCCLKSIFYFHLNCI